MRLNNVYCFGYKGLAYLTARIILLDHCEPVIFNFPMVAFLLTQSTPHLDYYMLIIHIMVPLWIWAQDFALYWGVWYGSSIFHSGGHHVKNGFPAASAGYFGRHLSWSSNHTGVSHNSSGHWTPSKSASARFCKNNSWRKESTMFQCSPDYFVGRRTI